MAQKPVSRRTLLKTILAGGAAVSSSAFLPKKWVKPVVESGVLPVHAQVSGTGNISGTVRNPVASNMDEGGIAYTSVGRKSHRKAKAQVVAGQTINLYMGGTTTGTPYKTTLTDAAGRYEFLNLPPGLYTVCWQDVEQCNPTIEVIAGQTTILDFIRLLGAISGNISVPQNGSASTGGITFVTYNNPTTTNVCNPADQKIDLFLGGTMSKLETVTSGPSGDYKFDALEPGTYDVKPQKLVDEANNVVVVSGHTTTVNFQCKFAN
jgi:hypothetical protein